MKNEQIRTIEVYKETINRGIEDLLETAEALEYSEKVAMQLDAYILELDDLKVETNSAVIALLRNAGTECE